MPERAAGGTNGAPADGGGAPRGPSRLGVRSWGAVLERTARQIGPDHLAQWAAALAFYALLSLFPAMLAIVSMLGLVGAQALEPLIENLGGLAPSAGREIALDALRSIRDSDRAGIALAVSLAVAVWSSSAYIGAFIPAANVVWEVEEERPRLKKLAVRVVLTVTLLLLTALVALIVVITGPVAEQLGSLVGLGETAVAVWQYAKWPLLALAVMALVSLLYWASPNVRHPGWRWLMPGSVLAMVLWIAASLAFSLYVSSFGSYGALYGSIGAVLVLLMWMWLTNLAILLGAELNSELERERAIKAGMRPRDKTPFLPLRDSPP